MHSGPTDKRDAATDWREVEECLFWIEEINPTLREYERWLKLNDITAQDLEDATVPFLLPTQADYLGGR